MGKGLSRLQEAILLTAYENQQAEVAVPRHARPQDCYYAEILVSYYGWKTQLRDYHTGERIHGGQKFSRSQIGEQKYNAAMAAISRAAVRLESRGLVKVFHGLCKGNGVTLTAAGIDIARCLSVKQVTLCHHINR